MHGMDRECQAGSTAQHFIQFDQDSNFDLLQQFGGFRSVVSLVRAVRGS